MSDRLAPLLDRIRLLAHEQPNGAPERLLERMEHTLTDGYAEALALEGESLRIEREIALAVARMKRGEAAVPLDPLAARLVVAERELRSLRAELVLLRDQTDGVRAAVTAARAATAASV